MKTKAQTISALVDKKIDSLLNCTLKVSENRVINLISDLRNTPRTGKAVRIQKYNLNLPQRSIYDHIKSLAYNSDLLISTLSLNVDNNDFSCMIMYHDLAESIIGDIPDFTQKSLAGSLYKTHKTKAEEEEYANKLIKTSLPSEFKNEFSNAINTLSDNQQSKIKQIFMFIDKTDPIIAIWRYIYLFRKTIDIELFIESMADFFDNPKVIDYSVDIRSKKLIMFLQDKKNATIYYKYGSQVFGSLSKIDINQDLMLKLIEGRKMHFTPNTL